MGPAQKARSADSCVMAARIGEVQGHGDSAAWKAQKSNVLRIFEEFRVSTSTPEITALYPSKWDDLTEKVPMLALRCVDRACAETLLKNHISAVCPLLVGRVLVRSRQVSPTLRCAAIAGVVGVINAGKPLGPGPAANYLASLINQAAAEFKVVCAPM